MSGQRILFIQTQAENAGAQEVSRLLGEHLTNRGHTVRHLFFYKKSEDFSAPSDTVIVCQTRPSKWRFFSFIGEFYKAIRDFKPDCVFCFQHFGNVIGAPVARLAGCPVVIANQVTAPSLINPLVALLDKGLGIAGIYDRVTVNSNFLLDTYGRYPKRYVSRLGLIPQGFETKDYAMDKASARKKLGLPQGVPLLGVSARLNPAKQIDKVFTLLADQPEWHFAIAGQGPDFERLQNEAGKLEIASRVHFLGEFAPSQIGEFLASLDVFTFPSAAESFGLAAIEAAQAGVPVVANDLPVLREVLQANGKPCALFVDVMDPEAFASAIATVLKDSKVAQTFRDRSGDLKERYSLNAMVDAYEALATGKDLSTDKHQVMAVS
ncbi:glycosyltransferase family 4 protein [Roseibium sp.]|uniref:glycosyltransferase family 4 protein n=1 Tax=Roseibium sp. TaxID=1936156 RepID=UPI003D0B07A0